MHDTYMYTHTVSAPRSGGSCSLTGLSREKTQLLRELLKTFSMAPSSDHTSRFSFNWSLGRRKQGKEVKGEFYQGEELIFRGVLGSTPQLPPGHPCTPTHSCIRQNRNLIKNRKFLCLSWRPIALGLEAGNESCS